MESLSISSILKIVSDFGILGLIIFIWWQDSRRVDSIMDQYKKDMAEQRKMYETNVSLCKDFASVTNDLKDIVTLNIQVMTECKDAVNNNQFCPIIRVSKKKAMRLVTVDEEGG